MSLSSRSPAKNGLQFGGRRYYSVALSDFPSAGFSFTSWIRANGSGPIAFIGSKDQGTTFDSTTTTLAIRLNGGTVEVDVQSDQLSAPAPELTDSDSHHIAVTFQQAAGSASALVTVYVDAREIAAKTLSMQPEGGPVRTLLTSNPMMLGAEPADPGGDDPNTPRSLLASPMTDVHVYSRVLTQSEVATDATATATGNEDGLYLALPFDTAHINRATGELLDIGPSKRHATGTVMISRDTRFGYLSNFQGFPIGDRTFQFWIRASGNDRGTILSYADLSSSDHPNDGGRPWFVGKSGGVSVDGASAATSVNDGLWHHVSIVATASGQATVYVDGVAGPTGATDLTDTIDGQPLLLGARRATDADDEVFTGELADVRLWKVARSPDLIAGDANGAAPPPDTDPDLVAHWLLDDQHGGSDLSGHGNDLSIGGQSYPLAGLSLAIGGMQRAMLLAASGDGMRVPPVSVGTGDFSAECWFIPKTAGPILEAVDTTSGQRRLAMVMDSDGHVQLTFRKTDGTESRISSSGASLLGSDWHHVAVTRAGGTASLYINGELSGTLDAAIDLGTPASQNDTSPGVQPSNLGTTWGFGAVATPTDSSLLGSGPTQITGSLAEVRVWNRALQIGEVRGGMHHFLRGDEPGIVGRWGFEHGLGRDSSAAARHAVIAPAAKFTLDIVDLEPRDTPYLVAQTKLVEDYAFSPDPQRPGRLTPTPRTSYRVVLHAYDATGKALAGTPLTFDLQPDLAPEAVPSATLSYDTAAGTTQGTIGNGATLTLKTNALGNVSVSLPATGLIAPVLRVTAPFMQNGHALLVFPDRHAHDVLSKVTGAELLGNSEPGRARAVRPALIGAEHAGSADAVAASIRQFMSVAQERATQTRNPVLRDVDDRLLFPLEPEKVRRYENVYVSPAALVPASGVTAGHALVSAGTVTRQVVAVDMPSWNLTKNADGTLAYNQLDAAALDATLTQLAPRPVNRLTALLMPDSKRSVLTSADLTDALAFHDKHERGLFDFFQAIADAVTVVVHAVEAAVTDIAKAVKAVVVVVVDAVGSAVAAVVNTVYHAAQAVAGVLQKVAVAVTDVIEFVKELFHWGDILDTQKVVKAQLMSVLPYITSNLQSAKKMVVGQLDDAKTSVHNALEGLRADVLGAELAASESTSAYSQPKDMRASYVQNLLTDHADSATIAATSSDPPSDSGGSLIDTLTGATRQSTATSRITQRSAAMTATTETATSGLSAVLAALIPIVEEISDDLFDLAKLAVGSVFDALGTLLAEVDAMLKARIEIPLLTDLYEQVITNGETLNCYSLGALIGALPLTIIYKLAKGTSHGPFPGGTFDAPTIPWPYDANGQLITRTARTAPSPDEAYIITTWVFGGAFAGNMLVNGILAAVARYMGTAAPVGLSRASLAFAWIFQLTQFPLDAYRRIVYSDKTASAVVEQQIWWFQFLPVALDTYLFFRPAQEAATARKFRSIYMSFFGLLHMISFVALYAVEKNNDRVAQVDSGLKFMGNMVSCVPEADAFMKTPWAVLADAIALGLWELSAGLRLGFQIEADRRFLAR